MADNWKTILPETMPLFCGEVGMRGCGFTMLNVIPLMMFDGKMRA